MPTTKILMTNEAALRRKYGASGWAEVRLAMESLVQADKRRGIRTQIIRLDSAADLTPFGARRVVGMSTKAFKAAIDAVCSSSSPDYVTIIGAADVVPHQNLKNPLCSRARPNADGEARVPSDLPYACSAAYNAEVRAFLAPSRVVGRIPDLIGAGTPEHLLELLRVAAAAVPHAHVDADFFAVSAKVWRGSTKASLRALFGTSNGLALSPTAGPRWTKGELKARVHFINCHGAPGAPDFYGQDGDDLPAAHSASELAGKIQPGTVVAAECCYGAELYDPTLGPPMGICQAYLGAGAYGFLGSTNIAYGPLDPPNSAADLMCRYFLESVLQGASLGRSLLEARQRFIKDASPLDPIDLKTVAQFHLLGDASIHAAKPSASAPAAKTGLRGAVSVPGTSPGSRRSALRSVATKLAATTSGAVPGGPPPSARVRAALRKASALRGLSIGALSSFVASGPEHSAPRETLRGARAPKASATDTPKFYVAFAQVDHARRGAAESGPAALSADLVYVAREIDGNVEVRELQQKARANDRARG